MLYIDYISVKLEEKKTLAIIEHYGMSGMKTGTSHRLLPKLEMQKGKVTTESQNNRISQGQMG